MRWSPGHGADDALPVDSRGDGLAAGIGPDPEPGLRAPLARFGNVAEAGFFADELTGRLDVPVSVRAEPAFDGMEHVWRTRYWLIVPETHREKAALALQELIEATHGHDEEELADPPSPSVAASLSPAPHEAVERFDIEPASPSGGSVNWVPIVLTLTAGSAVLCAFRWYDEVRRPGPQRPPAGPMVDLWDTLSESPGAWTQPTNDGRGRRELRLDRRRGVAVLKEDADGDGRPERVLQIPRPEPEWQPNP